jgi:hypothetical protein
MVIRKLMKNALKIKPVARVRLEEDGRISVELRNIGMPSMGVSTYYIKSGESLYSRSFRYWKKFAGKKIALSQHRGSCPGMIGGPKTIKLASIHSDLCDSGLFQSRDQALSVIQSFKKNLADPRISYTAVAKEQIFRHIDSASRFLKEFS